MYWYESIGRNTNLEKPHKRNSTFWKVKPYIKITLNEHLCLLSTGTSYWMNYGLKVSKSRVPLRNIELQNSLQLDSWWIFWPDSSFWMPWPDSHIPTPFLVMLFPAKEFISKKAFQCLNLNRLSISGLEPESSVTDLSPSSLLRFPLWENMWERCLTVKLASYNHKVRG